MDCHHFIFFGSFFLGVLMIWAFRWHVRVQTLTFLKYTTQHTTLSHSDGSTILVQLRQNKQNVVRWGFFFRLVIELTKKKKSSVHYYFKLLLVQDVINVVWFYFHGGVLHYTLTPSDECLYIIRIIIFPSNRTLIIKWGIIPFYLFIILRENHCLKMKIPRFKHVRGKHMYHSHVIGCNYSKE